MTHALLPGVIRSVPQPFTYRVRLDDGREVLAQPSRLHFGNRPEDVEQLRALQPEAAVTIRLTSTDPSQGWLVRAARTADEWRSSRDPATLLECLRGTARERSLRLFACACCRAVWDLIPEGPHRRLVAVIEAYADGRATLAELTGAMAAGAEDDVRLSDQAHDAEEDAVRGSELAATVRAVRATRIAAYVPRKGAEDDILLDVALDAARSCMEAVGMRARAEAAAWVSKTVPDPDTASPATIENAATAAEEAAYASQAEIVREVFGNPFHPIQVEPTWTTTQVVELARTLSASGDSTRFPELAAALEAAGCTERALLDHCRTPRLHVRGCWVLTLLMEQS